MGILSAFRFAFQNLFFTPILYGVIASLAVFSTVWDSGDRFKDQLTDRFRSQDDTFDFIIVGGGSAGAVLANRLSELHTVLLLEAGGESHPFQAIPGLSIFLSKQPGTDWMHKSVTQSKSCFACRHKKYIFSQGKNLGGTGNLNYLMHLRGNPQDFDNWATITGDPTWGYDGVLPYFIRSEHFVGDTSDKNAHGYGGPLQIQIPDCIGLAEEWNQAGVEMGYPHIDLNGRHTEGFDTVFYPIKTGVRQATYRSFIQPARNRPSLLIRKFAHVNKILIREGKINEAHGVEYDRHGHRKHAFANKEVIISAGTLQTPKLLILSGVGQLEHLKALRIPAKSIVPVGKNLQDHFSTLLGPFYINKPRTISFDRDIDKQSFVTFATNGKGPLTTSGFQAAAVLASSFAKAQSQGGWPDLQLTLFGLTPHRMFYSDIGHAFGIREDVLRRYYGDATGKENAFFIMVTLTRPLSKGDLCLTSNNPYRPAVIQPNYVCDDLGHDIKVLTEGIHRALYLAENTTTFQALETTYSHKCFPGCENVPFRSDSYWECYVRSFSIANGDHVGTCAMGQVGSPYAVVDPQLKVQGIDRLRVVDASVMPTIVGTPTQAATIMIAEKGAALILNRWKDEVKTLYGPPGKVPGNPVQEYGPPGKVPGNPVQQYGPPGQPGQQYGPPGQPGQQYGPPGKPGQQYGPPSQPGQQYGPPGKPGQQYGPPSQPDQQYGPPGQLPGKPVQEYGPPTQVPGPPVQQYGPPSAAPPVVNGQYGPPSISPPPVPGGDGFGNYDSFSVIKDQLNPGGTPGPTLIPLQPPVQLWSTPAPFPGTATPVRENSFGSTPEPQLYTPEPSQILLPPAQQSTNPGPTFATSYSTSNIDFSGSGVSSTSNYPLDFDASRSEKSSVASDIDSQRVDLDGQEVSNNNGSSLRQGKSFEGTVPPPVPDGNQLGPGFYETIKPGISTASTPNPSSFLSTPTTTDASYRDVTETELVNEGPGYKVVRKRIRTTPRIIINPRGHLGHQNVRRKVVRQKLTESLESLFLTTSSVRPVPKEIVKIRRRRPISFRRVQTTAVPTTIESPTEDFETTVYANTFTGAYDYTTPTPSQTLDDSDSGTKNGRKRFVRKMYSRPLNFNGRSRLSNVRSPNHNQLAAESVTATAVIVTAPPEFFEADSTTVTPDVAEERVDTTNNDELLQEEDTTEIPAVVAVAEGKNSDDNDDDGVIRGEKVEPPPTSSTPPVVVFKNIELEDAEELVRETRSFSVSVSNSTSSTSFDLDQNLLAEESRNPIMVVDLNPIPEILAPKVNSDGKEHETIALEMDEDISDPDVDTNDGKDGNSEYDYDTPDEDSNEKSVKVSLPTDSIENVNGSSFSETNTSISKNGLQNAKETRFSFESRNVSSIKIVEPIAVNITSLSSSKQEDDYDDEAFATTVPRTTINPRHMFRIRNKLVRMHS